MTKFETQTCSRCKGEGKYSFCERYRDRCFKCAGSGIVYTPRGLKAHQFYIESLKVKTSTLKAGDRVLCNGRTLGGMLYQYVGTVVSIERSTSEVSGSNGGVSFRYYPLTINTEHAEHSKHGPLSFSSSDESLVRIYRPDDRERLEAALAYQKTLTKAGTVRKVKAS